MRNETGIISYSAAELSAMLEAGESQTDWLRVDAKTEEELAQDIASDPDWADVPRDWHLAAVPVTPNPKKLLSLRLDSDIVAWFRAQGPGYQTRINNVLRAFVHHAQTHATTNTPLPPLSEN